MPGASARAAHRARCRQRRRDTMRGDARRQAACHAANMSACAQHCLAVFTQQPRGTVRDVMRRVARSTAASKDDAARYERATLSPKIAPCARALCCRARDGAQPLL